MLVFDQRFFKLDKAIYKSGKKLLLLQFQCTGAYMPIIPKHEKNMTKQLQDYLETTDITIEFEYTAAPSPRGGLDPSAAPSADALEKLKSYADNHQDTPQKVDKTLAVKNIEYWLGVPVKIRPVQIKYLRVGRELQVTAGSIHFLKKREYTRDAGPNSQSPKTTHIYWTFMLDDGTNRLQCVFFPTDKTRAKFEKLTDRTVVCVIGVHDKNKRGDIGFRVSGVSFCEM